MACNCNENTNPCGCSDNQDCTCKVLISSDCVNNVTEDLQCSGIVKGQTLTEALVQLDDYICEKFQSVTAFGNIVNIGLGVEVFKQTNNLGYKELRTLVQAGIVTVTENSEDITISLNETLLEAFVKSHQFIYSISNVTNGGQSFYRNQTIVSNNNQFNFKGLKLQTTGDGVSILNDLSSNTNDVIISGKTVKSNSLTVKEVGGSIEIDLPSSASIPALYVNSAYIPTYDEWFKLKDDLGVYKGDGTQAKPFTNTITYTSPTTFVVSADTAVENAVTAYIGIGTALNPISSYEGQEIIIENNPNAQYIYTGNFSVNNIKIRLRGYLKSTTTGWLIDMDDSTKFDTTNSSFIITIEDGFILEIVGQGFRNSGNTNSGTTYSSGRIGYLLGGGRVYSSYNGANNSSQYIVNADPGSTGNNNDGNVCFLVKCELYAMKQGVYLVGGKGKIDFYNTLTSGLLTEDVTTSTIRTFHQIGGQVRMFNNLVIFNNAGLSITRNYGVSFQPLGFDVSYTSIGTAYNGNALHLFHKTTGTGSNTVYMNVTNSPSGYGLTITNVILDANLSQPLNIYFNNNVLSSGRLANVDLTNGNLTSVVNFIGGQVIESLIFQPSKEAMKSFNYTKGTAFILRKTVAAANLVSGTEYEIATLGTTNFTTVGATVNTIGQFFTATGTASGTGTVYLDRRTTV